MNRPIVITHHAAQRLKERVGIPRSAQRSTAQRAFDEGIDHSAARGQLKKYFDAVFLSHRTANNLRVLGTHVFVFRERVLITVLHLPHELMGAVRKSKVA